MHPLLTLAVYCALIAASSLFGGWLPLLIRMTHLRTQLLMSFVAGLMLGVSFFVLLPHAVGELDSVDVAVRWLMIGFVAMFILIRAFHFHQHEPFPLDSPELVTAHADRACSHEDHHRPQLPQTAFNWLGLAFGLSVHTLIDGVAMAANVMADAAEGSTGPLLGVGTFLAVVLHKPLDALSITALMTAGGWSLSARRWVNLGFSIMCPLGALCFFAGLEGLAADQHLVLGGVLAFAAGVFLCISLADLMPELELHSHNRVWLSASLLLGIVLAFGLHGLEPTEAHTHAPHAESSH
jgi:zinc and cadmium transporter